VSHADLIFKSNLRKLLLEGVSDEDQKVRPVWKDGTPAHTLKVFGVLNTYDLSREFPIITLRPTAWKSGLKEIFWIYQDQSNDVEMLEEKYGVGYWKYWANQDGNLGKAYGYQMKQVHWYEDVKGYMSQIDRLIYDLKHNPYSRRHIVNLYNHHDLHDMTLAPCAFMSMWDVVGDTLNMTLVQRSSDYVLAGNINVTQYALLQHMIAQSVGLKVGKLNHYINNLHIYDRHIEQAKELLDRRIKDAPTLKINPNVTDFYDFTVDDFELIGYNPHEQMKFEIAI
jgi:thymidylate synthase